MRAVMRSNWGTRCRGIHEEHRAATIKLRAGNTCKRHATRILRNSIPDLSRSTIGEPVLPMNCVFVTLAA